jgi:alkylation response protein AidB-like acyl-CoA dehydrogenase
LRALGYKGFASFAQGSSAPEHSYMKMATSEAGKAAFELGMEIAGPMAPVTDTSFADVGRWSHGFFMSFANTIAGGSSEIQRNIIAQRVLGLPRA